METDRIRLWGMVLRRSAPSRGRRRRKIYQWQGFESERQMKGERSMKYIILKK